MEVTGMDYAAPLRVFSYGGGWQSNAALGRGGVK